MRTNTAVRIAYILLTANKPLTTMEICRKADCDRKSVYVGIDVLETSGFITTKVKKGITNEYTCKIRE